MSLRADHLTIADHVRDAAAALQAAGRESARHDAERLAAHALDVSWGDLWTRLRDPVDAEAIDTLRDLVQRRCAGEPLGYILGSVVFAGVEIACGPGVLVPRPETETLVEVGLELITGRAAPVVVDIGTGTGAVAIAIACARRDARVVATDVSEDALSYAVRNAKANGVAIDITCGDLFDALDATLRGRVDLVVSNPPYVPDGTVLPPDVSAEPGAALRAGPRGDEVLMRLVDGAPDVLSPDGALAVEVGTPDQASAVHERLREGFRTTGVGQDMTGRPRVVWGRR